MKNITVIGAGTMGNGIAHVFAQQDFKVNLVDMHRAALDKAMILIDKNLDRQVKKGSIDNKSKENTLHNIKPFVELKDAVEDADLVIEAVSENLSLKLKIFKEVDAFAPDDCILGSNTSSISITKLAAATRRPDKVIGIHFMNPVPVMPLIEVISGFSTSDTTISWVMDLCSQLDKMPFLVQDFPGFVANRILMPMINEAIFTLYEGVAGVEEIDQIMKLGMSHPMGPLQLADFIGLDICLSIMEVLHQGFGQPKYAPCPLLINMVNAGDIGKKSGKGFYTYLEGSKEKKVSDRFKRI